MKKNIKIVSAAGIGNILEFYDFTLYGAFAAVLASQFFPSQDPLTSLLSTFGVFAIGFFVRPFGSLLFGYIGDKYGRKKALTWSVALMSIPTLLIALTPTYNMVGVYAPIFLTLCRVLQGLCAGGEFMGSAVFTLEHMLPKKRGLVGGILIFTCVGGAMLASVVAKILNGLDLPDWKWRLAFLFGAFIGVIGMYIRKSLNETEAFKELEEKAQLSQNPVANIFKFHRKSLFAMITVGGLNGATIYTLFGYSVSYLIKVAGVDASMAYSASIVGLLTLMFCAPLFGYVADRYNPRSVMLVGALGVLSVAYTYYSGLLSQDPCILLASQALLGLFAGMYVGPQHLFSFNLFPTKDRMTGMSIGYALGMAFIGGTTPLISTYLISETGLAVAPSMWLGFVAILALIANRVVK